MNLRHSLLLVTLAFGAGTLFTLWKQGELQGLFTTTEQEVPKQPETAPELQSDAFSLRLLQAALECTEGNILLVPHALAENLHALQQMSRGATKTELEALQLGTARQAAAESAGEVALLFPDNSLSLHEKAPLDNAIPVPLSGRDGEPLLMLNSVLCEATGDSQAHFINGDHLAAGARLISFCSLVLQPKWKHPMLSAPDAKTDFFNADGSMPQVHTVQSNGTFRRVKAQDDSWQAVAIPLQLSAKSATDECLILVIPRENSARRFAQKLTREKMSSIQKSLTEAEAESFCVEFPRLSFAPPTQDLSLILQELGLGQLLSPQADLSGLATDKPLFLNAALQKCRIPLVEDQSPPPTGLPDIRVDKPFIWMIGALHSPAPPFAIGIVENL